MDIKFNDSREFYDLCRRYKYYYNAVQELKKVDGKYWNKHLRQALDDAEDGLEDTTKRMMLMVFGEFSNPNNTSIEVNRDIIRGGYHPIITGESYSVTIENNQLHELIQILMELWIR